MKTGGHVCQRESDKLSRVPHGNFWYRSNHGVIMQLTDGTVQVI